MTKPQSTLPSSPPSVKMDIHLKLLLFLLSNMPLMVHVAILHVLRLSEPAKYLDLRSHLAVSLLRSFFESAKPPSLSYLQKLTTQNIEAKGKIWVSTYISPPPPEAGIRDSLLEVLKSTREPVMAEAEVRIPKLAYVEAEWTGYRAAASSDQPLPAISEAAKYHEMMKECREPTTLMYLHGGAYYLGDPATHRPTVKKLAKLTGGRCYSVRYRLAPQHPFPSALLDAFVSYFTLLYPPPDAFHEAVKPEHVVVAGDSAGGNLSFALLQLLLQLRRLGVRVQWYGEPRQVPLPAAVTCISPWVDITQSSPSWQGDNPHMFDYLPKPRPSQEAKIPPCSIWPANPPRKHIYVDDNLAAHPLVSLIMNRNWEGSPPIYMCTGWELIAYEDKALAKKLAGDGVPLVFEEYEAMPHCFALLLSRLPSTRRCYDGWVDFIRRAINNPAGIKSSAITIKSRTLEEVPLRFENLLNDCLEDFQAHVSLNVGLGDQEPRVSSKL